MKTLISRTLIGAAILAALGGCAHQSLVYNEARDKKAQEAKKAATELKMADKVRALEKSYAEVAKLEEQSALSLAEALRDRELTGVAQAKTLRANPPDESPETAGLLTVMEKRLADLGAKPGPGTTNLDDKKIRNCGPLECASLTTIQNTPVSLSARQRTFEISRAEARAMLGFDFRTCADVKAMENPTAPGTPAPAFAARFAPGAALSRTTVATQYKPLADACNNIAAAETKFDGTLIPKGSLIRGVLSEARRAEEEVARYKAELVTAQAGLAAAAGDFAKVEKDLAAANGNLLSKLEERADKLKGIVENVKKGVGAVTDAGAHATAKELVDKLETVIGAVAGQDDANRKLDPDDRAAVAFVRAVPQLAMEADKLLKEAGRARLVPFAIARDHYRLEVKGFEDALAIKMRRADALRARADAMRQELYALARAHNFLTSNMSASAEKSLADINNAGSRTERQALYQGLAVYWDEVFLHRAEAEMWKARAQSLQYNEGLARSMTAAQQWDNLIGGVGTVLADYHAAGVKPSDITEFLKAAGLVYIGARIGR